MEYPQSEELVDGALSMLFAIGVALFGSAASFYISIGQVTAAYSCSPYISNDPCIDLVNSFDGLATAAVGVGGAAILTAVVLTYVRSG